MRHNILGLGESSAYPHNIIAGNSVAMRDLIRFVEKTARSESCVLILGETGVGKGLAAKTIHQLSSRNTHPFLKINCANLPEGLLESELFGYSKGAFTGAITEKAGLLEVANGGSVLFDEIGDLSLSVQAKILGVIEDKELRRIGETYFRKINVRFIFATSRNIYDLISKNKFRCDLFYRINIWSHNILPLRKRKEDIPLLINAIIKKIYRDKGSHIEVSEDAMSKITSHDYPGNVRELENIISRAYELSDGYVITQGDIYFDELIKKHSENKRTKYRAENIIDAMIKCRGNKTKAAKELNVSRVHLYRLLKNNK